MKTKKNFRVENTINLSVCKPASYPPKKIADNLLKNNNLKRIALIIILFFTTVAQSIYAQNLSGTVSVRLSGTITPTSFSNQNSLKQAVESTTTPTNYQRITSIEITAGKFTAADWDYLKSMNSKFLSFESFTITNGITSVADITTNPFTQGTQNISIAKLKTIPDSLLRYKAIYLKTANFPDVTTVGKSALQGCSSLTTAKLPKVENIGEKAFYGCKNLANLYINKKPPTVKYNSFEFIDTNQILTFVDETGNVLSGTALLDAQNAYYNIQKDGHWQQWTIYGVSGKINTFSFNKCKSILYAMKLSGIAYDKITSIEITAGALAYSDWSSINYYPKNLTDFTITNGITKFLPPFSHNVFRDKIKNVYIAKMKNPNRINFKNNPGLTTIVFPDVDTIEKETFKNCTTLTTVTLPKVESIGKRAFDSCTALTTANFPEAKSIDNEAFKGCTDLTTVNFPKAEDINYKAFDSCSVLTTADFPKVKIINAMAFRNCTKLTTVNFPNAELIGSMAFKGCTALTTVTVTNFNSVTKIYNNAFDSCTALTTVKFLSAKVLRQNIFKNCTSLTKVKFFDTPIIPGKTFENCTSLTEVDIPFTKKISNLAFKNCTSLTKIHFPNVDTLYNYAFKECPNLTSATLPKIKLIGREVFEKLTNLRLGATPPKVTPDAFKDCPTPRQLIFVNSGNMLLFGNDLTTAQNNYKAADDGDVTDSLWYDWRIFYISPTGVSLNESSKTISVNDYFDLIPTITPSNATIKDVTWESSNTDIVIADCGQIEGVKPGTATVTVTTKDGNKTATCEVTIVAPISVDKVSLNESSKTLSVNEEFTLVATITPTNATNKNVTWKSSDATTVSVDANGKIRGLKVGTATITVTTKNGNKTATCEVTVENQTALENIDNQTVTVYPNPAKGAFTIKANDRYNLQITDISGKIITEKEITEKTTVELPTGVYLLKFTNKKETSLTRKVIVE